MQFTFRHFKCNKLDKNLFMKLNNPSEIVRLKMDALMFITFTLTLLSWQSRDLKKSKLDMNIHYFELQSFLKLLQECPESIMDCDYCVFKSEV